MPGFADGHLSLDPHLEQVGVRTAERIVLLGLALAVCLWLAVSLRSAVAERATLDIVFAPGRIAEDELRRGEELVGRAETLSPSTLPDYLRAQLLRREGRSKEAVRVLRTLVRREPQNVGAWGLLGAIAERLDSGEARTARRRVRELVPLSP